METKEIEKVALEHPQTIKLLVGKTPRKVIIVPGKIVNIVF
jgi:leucyl-tRNA synthetase